jgi:hypothetical protein
MLLWFLGTSVLTVWFVFRDPAFDYRLLLVGAVLPDLIDVPLGRAGWAHSLTVAVVVLVMIMLATRRRSAVRRLLLALPIGMLLHIVWDGAFTSAEVFWWPFSGGWGDVEVPSIARGWWNVPLEIAGAVALAWVWRTCGLADPQRRRRFLHTGQLIDARPSC